MLPLNSGVRPVGPRVRFHSACAPSITRPTAEASGRSGIRQAPRCFAVEFFAGAGTRRQARISVAPRGETSGESDFGKFGAGQVFALPCRPGSGSLGLTIRSSGQSNRFAIGAAA